jgi:hypothetical protein
MPASPGLEGQCFTVFAGAVTKYFWLGKIKGNEVYLLTL